MPILDQEPTTIRSGTFLSWNKVFSEYPANAGWVLVYTLVLQTNAATRLQVPAVANGADFIATLTVAQTTALVPGTYSFYGHVTKALETYEVYVSTIEVLPNLAAALTGDIRSRAKRALDKAHLIFEEITAGREVTINNRTFTARDIEEIILMKNTAQLDYDRELQASGIPQLGIDPKQIGVRFVRL